MIVTGGSRGIGAAVAAGAAARGYAVCVNYAQAHERAEALCARIRAEGGRALAARADVAREAEVVALFETVDRALGPPTALVNNAGVDREAPVARIATAELERIFAVNAIAPIVCSREAVRRMARSAGGAGGVIVNVSSISSLYGGLPHDVAYAASKGALDAFTYGLAREVAGDGVRVCGVRPGLTLTEMWGADAEQRAAARRAERGVPIGRIASPEEVANAVLWLCSPEASYVTGAILNVSGGRELNIRCD